MKKYIGYIRVSTKRQRDEGWSMDAQRKEIEQLVARGGGVLIGHYQETESGKRHDNRPQLLRALAQCRREKAALVVAKLDRLSRNVLFIATLMESNVELICCDMPNVNRLTLHILAAVAEDERIRISARVKTGLREAASQGVKLGSSRPGSWAGREHLREAGRKKAIAASAVSRRREAIAVYSDLVPLMQEMRPSKSFSEIASSLNTAGYRTRNGAAWSKAGVHRVLNRVK